MNIYDCFMYFDEDMLLDLRLNVLNDHVKKFIISEATYTHNGSPKKLNFDINKFRKFKDKIEYIIVDKQPSSIFQLTENENAEERGKKLILNGMARDYFQRESLKRGLVETSDDDLILISDLDEIPNMDKIDISKINNSIVIFEQKMFYYKLNLFYEEYTWLGTKAVKKKKFISPQWLRNIKGKKYPKWRIDTFFSKKKYSNVKIIEDGGWHFSNIKTAKMLNHKFKSYLHHIEFDKAEIDENDIQKLINDKQAVYNLAVDQRGNKVGNGTILENFDNKKLPLYIQKNLEKFKDWLN